MFPKTLKIKNTGFSLVELVIVIAVLAILTAVSIPAYTHITKSAKVANAKSNLILINNYSGLFFFQEGNAPKDCEKVWICEKVIYKTEDEFNNSSCGSS